MNYGYSLDGNHQKLDGGAMFGNCPKALWQRWIQPDEKGRIPLACRSLLIPHRQRYILLEAGVGCFFEPTLAERYGITPTTHHLLQHHFTHLGIKAHDISTVILSHLHFDHAGGVLKPPHARKLQAHRPECHDIFPHSRYILSEGAVERALHPHPRDHASYPEALQNWLRSALKHSPQRFEVLPPHATSSNSLGADFEFILSHGHTPAQLHTLWHAADHLKIFFCGDLIPGVPWVHLPITAGYDRYPEKLIDEKLSLYPRALREGWWFFYTHDPQICLSQIRRTQSRRYEAVRCVEKLLSGITPLRKKDLS